MNNVSILGRMTKDPELRRTSENKPVLSFCVAVDAAKDKAYFIDCVAWGDKAEAITKYFKKGDRIGITGNLTTRMYEQDGKNRKATEVTVLTYDFCMNKKPEEVAPSRTESEAPEMEYNPATGDIMVEGGEKPKQTAQEAVPEEQGALPFEI